MVFTNPYKGLTSINNQPRIDFIFRSIFEYIEYLFNTITPFTRTINTTYPLMGGGDLSVDRTFYIVQSSPTQSGYITSTNYTNWYTAYNDSIVSASVTGTTTKTLTLNQQDGGTITASWTDVDTAPVISVFGRIGAIVAQSGDYTTTLVTEGTNLYFTNARAIASTLTGYVSGAGTITSSDSILTAIEKLDGNISGLSSVYFPLQGGTLTGTGGNGFVGFNSQSSTPSTPSSGFRLYANSSNALSWIGANGFTRTFDGTSNTANRTYTLPNINGTFILGTGIANQLAYFDTTNSISNLDTATYPSLTELSYVKGVTSSIQTQINNKFTLPSLTNGSVLFSNGTTIAQDNANFFWDNSTATLRLGNTGSTGLRFNLFGNFNHTLASPNTTLRTLARTGSAITVTESFDGATYFIAHSGAGYFINSSGRSYINAGGSTGFWMSENRNVVIQNGGTFTDAGFRLDVQGTARVHSNAANQFTISNPGFVNGRVRINVPDNHSFSILDNDGYGISSSTGSGLRLNSRSTNFAIWTQATNTLIFNLGGQDTNPTVARTRTTIQPVQSSTTLFSPTSGTAIDYSIENTGNAVFSPTSGSTSYIQLQLRPSINATGTYSGTVRGLFYNPILTSLTGVTHRAIETVSGDVIFGSTSGNVGIGATTTIDASTLLQLTSTSRGFLQPRMTTSQWDAISTKAQGLEAFDTTQQKPVYVGTTSGINQWVNSTIFTQTNTVTISNTVTETSILGTGIGTKTLPANFFSIGKIVRLTIRGYMNETSTPTIRIRLKLGSTTIFDSTAVTINALGGTDKYFDASYDIVCRTTGATGTVFPQGRWQYVANSGVNSVINGAATSATTIDTTTSQTIDLTVQWGVASASNNVNSTSCSIEILN